MKKALIAVPVFLVLGVGAAAKFIDVRKDLVSQREAVTTQWAQVDQALQRRADLIPNLVAAMKGISTHESDIVEKIATARAALAAGQTPEQKFQANDQLSEGLARLLLSSEKYPQLRSDENFLRLQDEIAGAENRIAVERRKYNEILEHYNAQIQRFPDNVVASLSGFARNDAYFRTDGSNRAAPKERF